MTTRRKFLQSSAVAAGAALAAPALRADAPEQQSLPRAIAALTSMKAQEQPISKEERRGRIEKARRLMAERKLDAVLIAPGTSLVYFSNIHWWPSERFFAMVLPAKGSPFYISPAFEHDRAVEQISNGPLDKDPDIRTWQEDEN